MHQTLAIYIEDLALDTFSSERKKLLDLLVDYIEAKSAQESNQQINLNFICTHNSRRSQFAQIWAQTMAAHFGFEKIRAYSGGTEKTAVYPEVIDALRRVGFETTTKSSGINPHYFIGFSGLKNSLEVYSKRWDDGQNPTQEFAAVMTCSHADENCPFIPGAEVRIPLTYNDPKEFDASPMKAQKYDECCRQIAAELKYVFQSLESHQ